MQDIDTESARYCLVLRARIPKIAHVHEGNLALFLKIAVIVAASSAVFYQDLAILANDALQNEIMSHILVIPFLFCYLIYRKRKILRAVMPLGSRNQPKVTKHVSTAVGILLSATAILLYWYGSYTFIPLEYHILAIPVFMAGLILVLFNPQTLRQLAFPVAFLTLLMPPPNAVLYGVGATLSVISAENSNLILNALGVNSTISSEYGNPVIHITRSNGTTIPFMVDIACSGIYSLIGFIIFAIFIVYIIRDKPWKRAVIFPIGLLLVYLLNTTRITTILLIGYHYGKETALQVFHLVGGWVLIFLGTMLLLTITEKILKTHVSLKPSAFTPCKHELEQSNDKRNFCSSCGKLLKYPRTQLKKQDLAKVATIAIAVSLLLYIQAPVFALKKGPSKLIIYTPTGEQATTQILPEIQGYTLKFVQRDENFEKMAKQDASLVYAYIPSDMTKETIWVTIEIASTSASLHRWELCFITWPQSQGYQPKVTQLDLRDIQILENPPILARYFVFRYTEANQTQVVLYWREKSSFQINATVQEKHVKISVIASARERALESSVETESLLATIASAIAQHWQPLKTWMQISILLSLNSDKLILVTTGLLTILAAALVIERRREKNANLNAYQKLSESVRQIIIVIHQTQEKTASTLDKIAVAYRNTVGRRISEENLLNVLGEIEKTGVVKEQVISKEDEPIQVWKTTMSFPKAQRSSRGDTPI